MIDRALLIAKLLEYHAPNFYNDSLGTFNSRGRAALVAETIRKLLHHASPKLQDSRFVDVQGKAAGCYVFIPRILHQWHPLDGRTIEAELEAIVNELLKDLS